MPLARYFVVVGGTLVALLFAADWYLAEGPADTSTLPVKYAPALPHAEDFELGVQFDYKWPDKLLLDTELPQ